MKLHVVPARTGWLWVKLGFRVFMRQPLALAGIFFMFIASIFVVVALAEWVSPAVARFLALALIPAATLGMMTATEEASRGIFPLPKHLLVAFRGTPQHRRAMAVLCLLYALGLLMILGISALFDGGTFAAAYLGTGPMIDPKGAAAPGLRSAVIATGLLHIPFSLLFWHAPALVHWHGVSPIKSLFFSFVACLRNFGAFMFFGLAWLSLLMLAGMAAMILAGALGGPERVGGVITVMAPLMAAAFSTSVFFTFRDTFGLEVQPSGEES